ncbi:MAG: vWA domain-containing protein [Rubrivivax sp.]
MMLGRTPAVAASHLATNVMHFARVLRHAGLPVGTDRVQVALQALQVAGLHSRAEFHAVLCACLLDRHEHQELFDQAFTLFWQEPDLAGRMRALLLPQVNTRVPPPVKENRRLGEALFPGQRDAPAKNPPPEQLELEASLTASASERLQQADFETMTADEFRAALRLLARLRTVFPPVVTRRRAASPRAGRLDLRATLREAGRHGGEIFALRHTAPRTVVPPLVVLADISGSMSRYSRMLLHFAHLLGARPGRTLPRVETFVFGTRLTRITPWLRQRDPDVAVDRVTAGVQDWSGGTRITESLQAFNRRWARRVLGSRATVLLVSDGLEHGPTEALTFEMERLHKSCHRLLWLNPLLRFTRFEPRAAGIRAMLPHVDGFLPVHNLQSLEQLLEVLASGAVRPG